MSPEKDAALCKAFPHLFRDRNASMQQTAMCWGFEHQDGWYDLIYEVSSKLEPIIVKMIDDAIKTKNFDELDNIPAASQVKEKYGTLCFYMSWGTDEIYNIISKAEKKSAKICEECGKPGKLHGDAWVFTRCNKCWKELEKERYGK